MSLKHAILVLLDVKAGTGYDIAKEFHAGMGFMWSASHQQIYMELKKLAQAQWVSFRTQTQSERPDKKVYSITSHGRIELLNWLEKPIASSKLRAPFMIEMAAAHLASPDKLLIDTRAQQQFYQKKLEEYQRYERYYHAFGRDFQNKYRLKYLALEHAMEQTQLSLKWLTKIEQEVLQLQIKNAART